MLGHGGGIRWPAFWRRWAFLVVAALLTTAGTYWMFPDYFVFFGVLHAIALFSLMALPFLSFSATSLTIFAIFYGLDWIATVPPTAKLTNQAFGEEDATIVFGWILTGHQLGAAVAAFGAGLIHQETGTYLPAFLISGAFGLVAAGALVISARKDSRRVLSSGASPA